MNMHDPTNQQPSTNNEQPIPARLLSLDALRGLSILLMLLVNSLFSWSGTPAQLRHAGWNGMHLADMAFPWFLLCVGIAVPLSASSAARRGVDSKSYALRIARRVLILLALGALLDTIGNGHLILFSVGVLQTIALAYAAGVLLYGLRPNARLLVAAAFLLAYWATIRFVPAPGMPTGSFEGDRNLILHLNRHYLGQLGLWNLTRLVPTSALVLIGTAIGDIVGRVDLDKLRIGIRLIKFGLAMVAMGYIWSLDLPFNKWMWTPAYILFSAGTGALTLGVFDLVIDVAGLRAWSFPLIVFGSNAILAYVLPIVSKPLILRPLHIYVHGWVGVVPFILFWWLFLWLLYSKKLFFRV
jgi:predicted acyltransferase